MDATNYIKVHFLGENMWVKIRHQEGNTATGTLDNDPVCSSTHGYREGDEVQIIKNGDFWEPRYRVKLHVNLN